VIVRRHEAGGGGIASRKQKGREETKNQSEEGKTKQKGPFTPHGTHTAGQAVASFFALQFFHRFFGLQALKDDGCRVMILLEQFRRVPFEWLLSKRPIEKQRVALSLPGHHANLDPYGGSPIFLEPRCEKWRAPLHQCSDVPFFD
jgi:hypothetical protein